MQTNRSFIIFVFAAVALLVLSACSSATEPAGSAAQEAAGETVAEEPAAEEAAVEEAAEEAVAEEAESDGPTGTFVVAVSQEPQDLAAQGAYKEINAHGLRNVIETLIALDPLTGKLIPVLATSWERIDDQTVRMELRQGVTFHDGTPFNAESAAFSINWVWSSENAFTIQELAGPGAITAEAVDEYTIEVKTEVPDPLLEFRLSLNGISSMKQIQDDPTAHFDHPIGTGPYKFVEWVRGQHWTMEFNPDWWGLTADDAYGASKPLFQEIRIVFRPEDASRVAMGQAGEADLVFSPSAEECAAAADAEGYRCVSGPSDRYLYGRLDHSLHADERLQDPRIREAVFLAIDIEALNDLIGLSSVPQGQLGAPGTIGFNPNLEPYPYDPDRAKQLLDEARADGVDVDGLTIEIVGRDTTPRISPIVEAIGGMLSAVGINNIVQVQVPDVFNPRVRIAGYEAEAPRSMMQVHVKGNPSGDYAILLQSNYACPDIDDATGPSRSSVYCNAEFDEQLAAASVLTGEERDAAMQELVQFVHDEHLIVPLAYLDNAYLLNNAYDYNFAFDHRFQAVYVSRATN